MTRIGIMGGTFDPIHNGHLRLGSQAREEYQLDQVWFMPSGQPPHKKDHFVTDAAVRLEMVRLAIAGRSGFALSDFEIRRPGNTYTAQTLALLNREYPDVLFYFIIGADSLYDIEKWYRPDLVMEQAVLLVAARDCEGAHPTLERQISYLKEKYGARIERLHSRTIHVSSEEIRTMVYNGEPLDGLLPEAVLDFVKQHGLYQMQTCTEGGRLNDRHHESCIIVSEASGN